MVYENTRCEWKYQLRKLMKDMCIPKKEQENILFKAETTYKGKKISDIKSPQGTRYWEEARANINLSMYNHGHRILMKYLDVMLGY